MALKEAYDLKANVNGEAKLEKVTEEVKDKVAEQLKQMNSHLKSLKGGLNNNNMNVENTDTKDSKVESSDMSKLMEMVSKLATDVKALKEADADEAKPEAEAPAAAPAEAPAEEPKAEESKEEAKEEEAEEPEEEAAEEKSKGYTIQSGYGSLGGGAFTVVRN